MRDFRNNLWSALKLRRNHKNRIYIIPIMKLCPKLFECKVSYRKNWPILFDHYQQRKHKIAWMSVTLTQQQTSIGVLASNGKAFDQTVLKRNKTAKNISLHYSLALRTINEVWWEDRNERAGSLEFHFILWELLLKNSHQEKWWETVYLLGEKKYANFREPQPRQKVCLFVDFVF